MKKANLFLATMSVFLMSSTFAAAEGQEPLRTDQNTVPGAGQPVSNDPDQMHIFAPGAESAYTDLGGHFAEQAAVHLTKLGMIDRQGEQAFRPNEAVKANDLHLWAQKTLGVELKANAGQATITRVEVAKLVADAMPAVNTGINGENLEAPYTDTKGVTAEQKAAIDYLYKLGIMIGDGNNRFLPNQALTRGEAAVLLDRAMLRSLQGATDVKHEVAATDNLPEAVAQKLESNREQAGLHAVIDGETRYLIVTAGPMPTAGYGLELVSLQETAAGIFVQTKVTKPAPGMMQAQVITYPSLVLKIDDLQKPVYQLEQAGEFVIAE